jgi:hypothetical protein
MRRWPRLACAAGVPRRGTCLSVQDSMIFGPEKIISPETLVFMEAIDIYGLILEESSKKSAPIHLIFMAKI